MLDPQCKRSNLRQRLHAAFCIWQQQFDVQHLQCCTVCSAHCLQVHYAVDGSMRLVAHCIPHLCRAMCTHDVDDVDDDASYGDTSKQHRITCRHQVCWPIHLVQFWFGWQPSLHWICKGAAPFSPTGNSWCIADWLANRQSIPLPYFWLCCLLSGSCWVLPAGLCCW